MTITNQILEFLSGNVPGGIMPYLLIIALVDLVLFVMGRNSELFHWPTFKRRIKIFTAFGFLIYMMAWYGLRPESLNPRFVIFPTISDTDSDYLAIPLLIDQNYKRDIQKEYFYHPARWIVHSADLDSILLKEYQIKLAKRMNADLYLLTWKEKGEYNWAINKVENSEQLSSGSDSNLNDLAKSISIAFNHLLDTNKMMKMTPEFSRISSLYWLSENDSTQSVIDNYEKADTSIQHNTIAEIVYSHAVIKHAYDEKKKQLLISNPFKRSNRYQKWFAEGRKNLINRGKIDPDNLQINLVLADAFILEENYYKAELALKNALVSDRFDAQIYFLLSFLNPDRYKDLGFDGVEDVLGKAILYDPMYQAAVSRFVDKVGNENVTANHYLYELSVKNCHHFLQIVPSSYRIWNDLAGLYLLGNYFDKALIANNEALKYAPHNEGVLFNAGIIRYRTNKYDEALKYFDELISRYNHLDSRLYRAMIYRKKGMYKEAVLDFRYRILHKKSDDDTYYKEAVKGIRRIRLDLEKKGINLDDIVPPYKIKG